MMMIAWWYLGLMMIGMISAQDNNANSNEIEPEVLVVLRVDTSESAGTFACHECSNCQEKSNLTTRHCQMGIDMCFTAHKRINKINQIIRRGCSIAKGQCTVPDDSQINSFDSVTCCTTYKCNQGTQLRSLLFLNLLIMMVWI